MEKNLCKQPPTPLEIASVWTLPPLGISVAFRGGVGVWTFSGTAYFAILYSSDNLVAILISTNSDDAKNVSTLLTTVVQALDGAFHQINQ